MTPHLDVSVDRRARSVAALVSPRSVLVVGASGSTASLSGVVMLTLRKFGFPGRVAAVNPKYDEIQGFPCYRDLSEVPPNLGFEHAVLAVPRDQVVEAARRCGDLGVRALTVITAGFAELDAAGANVQRQLVEVAAAADMALCGPNCAGVADFARSFVAYGTNNFLTLDDVVVGGAAIITASGGLGNTIFSYLQDHRIGCSKLISIGNEALTTAADYLDLFVEDETVSMVIAYIESVRDPRAFFGAVDRALAAGKPVVLLKPGRTQVAQAAVMTHTAALSGSHDAFAAWFARHGVIVVDDIDELAETAVALERVAGAGGDRIGLFSLPGGGLALVADHAEANGFSIHDLEQDTVDELRDMLPPLAVVRNPLDPSSGFRDSPHMADALVRFGSDPNIDIVVFFPLVSNVTVNDRLVDHLIDVRRRLDKPLVAIWTVSATPELQAGPWRRLRDAGIAVYTRTSACFAALARGRDHIRFVVAAPERARRDTGDVLAGPAWISDAVAAVARLRADPLTTLSELGFAVPRRALARSRDEAARLSLSFGRVALKVSSRDISHKSDVGGVRVGVEGGEAAAIVYDEILDAVNAATTDAVIDGIEIQEMAPEGVELLIGVTTDDQLGPRIVVGSGGVLTELIADHTSRPVPVASAEAAEMLAATRSSVLLDGYRGRPPGDRNAAIDAIVRLSQLAARLSSVGPEIDLNPLVVGPIGSGAWVVDARCEFAVDPS